MATKRTHEPGFVLHRYDWSESSLILEVFTRHHGRIALVAKGAKRPSSNFRPVLLPLQPLRVLRRRRRNPHAQGRRMGGRPRHADRRCAAVGLLRQRTAAAAAGARRSARGGCSTPTPPSCRCWLRARRGAAEPALRAFELLLLREIGLLPMLDAQTTTMQDLEPTARYSLVPEGGLRQRAADDRASLSGAQWQVAAARLDDGAPFTATLRACRRSHASGLKPQLRALLHYHCGVHAAHAALMMDLQAL
jgi:DNA repair protein RecO (recombination protein O)